MRTKLLKEIRKKYSYIWVLQLDGLYTNEEIAAGSYRTSLQLVVGNNQTKKGEMILYDHYPGAISQFILKAIGSARYEKLKTKHTNRKQKFNYELLLKKKKALEPNIINDQTYLYTK